MAETPNDPLLAYLREYGGRYTPEALRRHLLTQGYDADRVDAALDSYRREGAERGAGEPAMFSSFAAESERPSTLALVGVILAVLAGVALLLAGTCAGIVGLVAFSEFKDASMLAAFAGVAGAIGLAVALIVLPILIPAMPLLALAFFARRRNALPPLGALAELGPSAR
jgi:hypothetical protein